MSRYEISLSPFLYEVFEVVISDPCLIKRLEMHCNLNERDKMIDLNKVRTTPPTCLTPMYRKEKGFYTIIKNVIKKNGHYYGKQIPDPLYVAISNYAIDNSEKLKSIEVFQQI